MTPELYITEAAHIPLTVAPLVPWAEMLKVFGVLLLLIPLAYLATKMYGQRSPFGGQGRAMRILESISVGPGKSLCLVELPGNRVLVLGITAQQVRLLTELDDPSVLAEIKALHQEGTTKERFASILRRLGGDPQFQADDSSKEGRKE